MATANPSETLKQLDDFEKQVHDDIRGVANTPEVDSALGDFVAKLAELKAQVNDPAAYTRLEVEVNAAYDRLLAAQAKSIENRGNILAYFVTIENEITSLPPYVQENPIVAEKIDFIRAKIQEIRRDISKYKSSVDLFKEFSLFLEEQVPEIQLALEVMEGYRKTISQILPEVAADPRIAELVTELTKEIDAQTPKV